jgi:uncharacterized C2H2 Zn-finger protein
MPKGIKVTVRGKGFGRIENELRCPGCEGKFKVALAEMRPGSFTRCPSCGATFKFTGDDGAKIQEAFDKLDASIRKLGK